MFSRAEAGFSLIETIVALGVLATAAVSIGALSRGSIGGVKQLETRYLARTIAQQKLVEQFTSNVPLRADVLEGKTQQLGQNFIWTKTITPANQDGLFLVVVEVQLEASDTVLVRTSTLKGVS